MKSPHDNSIENIKLYDIDKKMIVAKEIVTACMNNRIDRENIKNNTFYDEAIFYTSTSDALNTVIFNKISKMEKPKTFSDWFEEQSLQGKSTFSNITEPLDILLRETLLNQYVIKQTIPTVKSICEEFKAKGLGSSEVEIKKILRMKGYIWQRLPRTNATIIIERPEQRVKKLKYLYQLVQCKNLNSHIIFIEDKIIMDKNDVDHLNNRYVIRILLAVSSSMGMIAKDVQKIPWGAGFDSFIKVDEWMLGKVLPYVSMPSVIVLEDGTESTSVISTPTVHSKKTYMIDWLVKNDIPHSREMHTGELYELIKKYHYKFSSEIYHLEELFKAHGHKLLHRPYPTNYFNVLSTIWDRMKSQKSAREDKELSGLIKITLSSLSIGQWRSLIEAFFNIEEKLYDDTNAIDEVVDKILTYAKYENVPDEFLHQFDEDIDELKMSEIIID